MWFSNVCLILTGIVVRFENEKEGMNPGLLEEKDRGRVERVLKYVEDGDLRKWTLPDSKAFNIGLKEWRSKLNCITNQYMFEEVLRSFQKLMW